MTNKEKFLALVSQKETKTVERAKQRLKQKSYSKLSNQIAFEILERLDELHWKQKDLAEKMNVSPQQVSKWVKGNENFTLETLVNLSDVLGISLITIPEQKPLKWTAETKLPTAKMSYEVKESKHSINPVVLRKAVV